MPVPDPQDVIVTVRHGVVTLTGRCGPRRASHDLVPLAMRLIWDVDGVVDVVNRLADTTAAQPVTTG